MRLRRAVADRPDPIERSGSAKPANTDSGVGFDPELEAALKAVLKIIYRDHPLTPNQILILSSELQRVGVHRLVESHIDQSKKRSR
jgi:hypothetical protein